MSKIGKFVEKNIFKARLIFVIPKSAGLCLSNDQLGYKLLIVRQKKDLLPNYKIELIDYILENKIDRRLENKEITLYLAIEKKNNKIAGYYWVVVPEKYVIWHDKFYVPLGSALGFDAYTIPAYRGTGVFPFLKSNAIRDQICFKGCDVFYSIVEKSNFASISSNKRLGAVIGGNNYLIKIMKRNFLSIIRLNDKWELYYVFRNAKSNNL